MKILIVDDEKELAEFLQTSFALEGYEVDVAFDGEDGFEKALNNEYCAIILDNVLPKKEGKQVCRELRNAGVHTPILMLSVKSEIETKVEMLDIGVDDYLTKPFSFEELAARVKALCRRPLEIKGEIYKVGALSLDPVKKKVIHKTKEVSLTGKEFSILACLMKNKGKIISKNEIMEFVWDENTDHFSNTLEAHIANIRKKISNGNQKDYIHTVVGRGYRMDTE
ncbi:MAG: response regulator transcription factor [Candidatus Magasanikbacteria bacterium]|nr:response regulator transcription factor [Candidatus Magasanikbacteria bacterium]